MLKRLLSGLFWVLLLNLLIKPFWILGVEVGVQNAVGDEEYGLYFGLFSLASILNILLDAGVTNFNTRNIARHPHLISKHLGGILAIKVALLGLYLAATLAAGLLLGFTGRRFALLALLCANQFLNSLILYLRSNFEGLLLFKWDSVLSVLDRLLMTAICGALLWAPGHPRFRIEYFVCAQTAAYLLTAATALLLLTRRAGFARLRFSRPFSLAILKQSLPFALLVLLMASYNRIDPILLQKLSPRGDGEAGIYAGAYRLLDALTMVPYLVSVPLLPVFARLTKGRPSAELGDTVRIATSLMAVFSITAAATLSAMDSRLMGLLYRENTEPLAAVFRLLILGIVPISFTYTFGTLLTAAGRLRQLNVLAAITLCINIAANLLLIPRYGAVGSAAASLTAQTFMAAAQTVAAIRQFDLFPQISYTIKLAAFALLIVAANWLLPDVEWWLRLGAAAALAIGAAAVLRLFDLRQLLALAKSR